jgi:hypothetical protein
MKFINVINALKTIPKEKYLSFIGLFIVFWFSFFISTKLSKSVFELSLNTRSSENPVFVHSKKFSISSLVKVKHGSVIDFPICSDKHTTPDIRLNDGSPFSDDGIFYALRSEQYKNWVIKHVTTNTTNKIYEIDAILGCEYNP